MIVFDFYKDEKLASAFFTLQEEVYDGLGLRWARDEGLLRENVVPFALINESGRALSILNATLMTMNIGGVDFRAVQIGTVATIPEQRAKGLAARLQRHVLEHYSKRVDFQFLFANSKVLQFYPKFGFRPVVQSRYRMRIRNSGSNSFAPMLLDTAGTALLKRLLSERSNISDTMNVRNCAWLTEFYCRKHFSKMLWIDQDRTTIVVANTNGPILELHDIISPNVSPSFFLELSWGNIEEVRPGFTPDRFEGEFEIEDLLGDQMFVQGNFPGGGGFRFPTLAHT